MLSLSQVGLPSSAKTHQIAPMANASEQNHEYAARTSRSAANPRSANCDPRLLTNAHPPPTKFKTATTEFQLSLHRKQERLLESFRDPAQKTRGIGAIDQPVIVRE